MQADDNAVLIEQWKIKRLIKRLDEAKGNGTSMISLIIPPKKAITDITKMLNDEQGTAVNIKSNVNRKSVLTAITSARERLKLYNKTPPNGLILYTGTVLGEDGRTEKKMVVDFEPFKPINKSLYLCDNKFHVADLKELLENEDVFGFIIVDGSGTLYGTLQGNAREVIHKFTVELPKKHGRGGQSSVRFARLRVEKRHNYLRKVAETATQVFITNDKPNVNGLVLAGSADFKNELYQTDMFDQRLKAKVLKVVDVSYGGENGFNQAVEMAQECLTNVKFVQEKKILSKFFEEISTDSGLVVFGIHDTMKVLETGAIETLLLFESLDIWRLVLKNKEDETTSVIFLNSDQLTDPKYYKDANTKAELETVESMQLSEWIAENYVNFGAALQFITDKSSEGFQFVKGFGGIGGFLRYKLDVDKFEPEEVDEDLEDDFI
jgi:peptide chain release factor subunit 1